jgi:putative transposase
MATIQERKHRLSTTLCRGEIPVSFTACIKGRIPTLNEREVFEALSDMLIDTLKRWNCDAHIFLFMPDHCHLLIQGKTNNSDLLGFMKDFKQRSGYWLSKRSLKAATTSKWQKDFYDHIMRQDEDINEQIKYILENPIRKGLVDDWKEYPFEGSTIYNFDGW